MRNTLLAIIFMSSISVALAHSPALVTRPQEGANLTKAPDEIYIEFKNRIRLTKLVWKFSGSSSGELSLEAHREFATEFVVPFVGSGSGSYEIEWRGLGEDGHAQSGTLSFTVD